eukprot:COSAG05_NODE_11971_length_488_cov_1.588689_1_plen_151_part_10
MVGAVVRWFLVLVAQVLATTPSLDVYKTFEDGFTYEGCVVDIDDDNQGGQLFGIQWSDGTRSDLDINEMRKYCVLNSDGGRLQARPRKPTSAPPRTCRTAPTVLLRVEDMLRTSLSAGRRRATLVRQAAPSPRAKATIGWRLYGGGCMGRS